MKKYKTTVAYLFYREQKPVDPIVPEEEGDWRLVSSAAATLKDGNVQVFWFWEKLV